MKFSFSDRFKKDYKNLPKPIQDAIDKQLFLLQLAYFCPSCFFLSYAVAGLAFMMRTASFLSVCAIISRRFLQEIFYHWQLLRRLHLL